MNDYIAIVAMPIVSIVNLLLSGGCLPSHFKSTLVSPLLQKPTLNKNDMKNYQPVYSVGFLSNILQSAYKKFHSTENALLKILNGIVSSWTMVDRLLLRCAAISTLRV